jgi:hypothetical protein
LSGLPIPAPQPRALPIPWLLGAAVALLAAGTAWWLRRAPDLPVGFTGTAPLMRDAESRARPAASADVATLGPGSADSLAEIPASALVGPTAGQREPCPDPRSAQLRLRLAGWDCGPRPEPGLVAEVRPLFDGDRRAAREFVTLPDDGWAELADLLPGRWEVRTAYGHRETVELLSGAMGELVLDCGVRSPGETGPDAERTVERRSVDVFVLDPSGAPVVGATVALDGAAVAQTDGQGRAALCCCRDGQVLAAWSATHLRVAGPAVSAYLADPVTITLGALGTALEVRVTLGGEEVCAGADAAERIELQIQTAPGMRLAQPDDPWEGGEMLLRTRVRAGETTRVEGLTPERWWGAVAYAPGYAPAKRRVWATATGPNVLELVLTPGAQVSGRVADSEGQPLAEAWVGAFPFEAFGSPWTRTDGEGRYVLRGLPTGPVQLEVEAGVQGTARGEVELCTAQPATLDFVVDLGPSVSGQVLGPEGLPLAQCRVALGHGSSRSTWSSATVTDADGSFRLGDVAPQGNRLLVFAPGAAVGDPPSAELDGVAAGTTDLELRLAALEARLSLPVEGPTGSPLEGAQLGLRPCGTTGDGWETRPWPGGGGALPVEPGCCDGVLFHPSLGYHYFEGLTAPCGDLVHWPAVRFAVPGWIEFEVLAPAARFELRDEAGRRHWSARLEAGRQTAGPLQPGSYTLFRIDWDQSRELGRLVLNAGERLQLP